jgi:membrane-bound lytic murein transglycosylase A
MTLPGSARQTHLHAQARLDARHVSLVIIVFFLLLLAACRPTPIRKAVTAEDALERVRFFIPRFADDMDLNSLATAIKRNLLYLDRLPQDALFSYGSTSVSRTRVIESQRALLSLLSRTKSIRQLNNEIRELFWIYRATGSSGNNKVLFTGYFEPTYEARLAPDANFRYPLYRKPDDLLTVNLSSFRKKFKGESIVGRLEGTTIVPYYSRLEIEVHKELEGKGLEIAWLKDPVDVAFLQIQGSGRLILPGNRTICVGYSGSNGRPYRSIGRYLIDHGLLEREHLSMQSIRKFLTTHPALVQEVLNFNPSYVFFRTLEDGPLGNIGVPLTPGRSIALDSKLFPKGALGFISSQKPVVDEKGVITEWSKFSRFVINQDTGGAIRGAGRADIFWGSGPYAEIAAGHMKHEGKLYLLIKKQ